MGPLWRRNSGSGASAAERPDPAWDEVGAEPCSQPGCAETNGVICAYVDRRNRGCTTAWCKGHRMVVEGHVYCRRHGGVMVALSGGPAERASLPDLSNRAPSLVSWVAREIDADVREILQSRAPQGALLAVDPVFLIFVGGQRHRAWERTWKVSDHTGHTVRVALQVEETADVEVCVKIGAVVRARVVPPWIAGRLKREQLDPFEDARARKAFNEKILKVIREGVDEELAYARRLQEQEQMLKGLSQNQGG